MGTCRGAVQYNTVCVCGCGSTSSGIPLPLVLDAWAISRLQGGATLVGSDGFSVSISHPINGKADQLKVRATGTGTQTQRASLSLSPVGFCRPIWWSLSTQMTPLASSWA